MLRIQTQTFLLIPILLLSAMGLQAQSENFSRDRESWYNRKIGISKYLIQIIDQHPQAAIKHANSQGEDAEADFIRAIAYAQMGKAHSAMHFVEASLAKQLPFGRYLVPGLEVMKPLQALPAFQTLAEQHSVKLLHGPMLGAMTGQSVSVWLRTDAERSVSVEISESRDFAEVLSVSGKTQALDENTATLVVRGLKPNSFYYYRVKVEGEIASDVKTFTSYASEGKAGNFSVIFGGGAAYIPWQHYMWSTINAHNPDALFLMGDNVYIDYPERPQVQRYCYHRRQSESHFRRLVGHTPVYAVWDDHDFGDNDDYGTPSLDQPAWKPKVLKTFKNQWVDPGYGNKGELPGVFFKKSIADVDFFFIDARYYRQPSVVGVTYEIPLSMLGKQQKAWLKRELSASTATFKVLVSQVPWSFKAKGALEGRVDTWLGYPVERKELFDYLAKEKIEGVFLLSADRHRSDLWRIDREGTYPLYEMESSRLTNTHFHKIMPQALFGYNEKCSFGKLNFDTTQKDPVVYYEIYSIDNELIYRFELKRSELK